MSRTDLLRDVWNWLPAFLEVAERGSVAEASRHLHLTPAAVSRTVRLLEETIGAQLFDRIGRGLVLNDAGRALREVVREAKGQLDRGLHDALFAAEADPFAGRLRVASLGVLTSHFVVPELLVLKATHESLVPEHQNLRTAEALAALERGELDVVFHYEAMDAESRRVERLGETHASVYCGRSHPLFGKKRVRREDVLAHPFSVPQVGDTGRVQDGWPSELPRQVGMRITLLASNLEVCLGGLLLTVLPDVVAAPHVAAKELRRLPFDPLPPIEVYASWKASEPDRVAPRALVEAVKARLTRRS
ncbi:MAG: LysR family transcriptional regulator [Sandaracinus sp.]|nr:LysR family transcriptional regulator [Sandaracinus sp.]MCB9621940.1 LysR family transcriptional regulator [Sandaracinus sp.]